MIASRNCEHKSIQQVVTENSAIILDIVVFLLHSIIMKYNETVSYYNVEQIKLFEFITQQHNTI